MNEYLEQARTRDTLEDAYERIARDEYDLHLRAMEARRFDECEPDPKPPRSPRKAEARDGRGARERFKRGVSDRDQGCVVHGNPADCAEGWQCHHVIPQQDLRRASRADLLWNPLSGMFVCGLAHRQHHSRVRPILLDEIPAEVVAFLRRNGFGDYLSRRYP